MSDTPSAPDLIYAKTRDGLDLPVIDFANPRFAVADDPESLAAQTATLLEWGRQRRWVPPFVTRLLFRHAAQRSRLVRAIYQSNRGFLDSITTYILKLGPENLPPGFDGPIDKRAAATPHVALVRLRMQQVARLLANALAPALAAEPATPLHLINIAGGPALDSINALIMLNRAGATLRARPIVIHVLDAHAEGPFFGANALAALQRPGAPLHGLAVELRHQVYDWNATQVLADLLARITREPAVTAASSEGGLFEYGGDEAIVANLEVLAAAPVGVKFVAGSVTSDNPLRKDMISVTTFKLHPRGAAGVAALAARAGYELERNLPTLMSDQVLLRLATGRSPRLPPVGLGSWGWRENFHRRLPNCDRTAPVHEVGVRNFPRVGALTRRARPVHGVGAELFPGPLPDPPPQAGEGVAVARPSLQPNVSPAGPESKWPGAIARPGAPPQFQFYESVIRVLRATQIMRKADPATRFLKSAEFLALIRPDGCRLKTCPGGADKLEVLNDRGRGLPGTFCRDPTEGRGASGLRKKRSQAMLTRSFLPATDLGISEVEREALITTLFAFERDEVDHFSMRHFRATCGTPACICGWANHLSGGAAFPEVSKMSGVLAVKSLYARLPQQLQYLFDIQGLPQQSGATQAHAAAALSNYLTFGEPRWAEVTA